MTVRALLESVRRQDALLRAKQAEMHLIELDIISMKSPQLGDKVQTNRHASLADTVEKLERYREGLRRDLAALIEAKEEATRIIRKEPDKEKQAILVYRYMVGKRWEWIADKMHYSPRRVYVMHSESICFLEGVQ